MRNLLNPKWIFVINTFPIIILLFLFFGEFSIVKTLLDEKSIFLWKSSGCILVFLGSINLLYAVYLTLKNREVPLYYGAGALLCYIPFVYFYGTISNEFFPSSIPRWIMPGDMILYPGTFLMPTLAYSLFVLVFHFTSNIKEYKVWKNFLIVILIPVFCYLFTQIIFPLWRPVDVAFSIHTFLILTIVLTLIFLFFLIRGLYICANRKTDIWLKYQIVWKISISIILPLLGLSVNNGLIFNNFGVSGSGLFGNFNNYWFYVLAIINGLFICLPNFEKKSYRLVLFIGRNITFAYTFYFFLVFLPFLPFSVIAIAVIGTGFLMLTPLTLFLIHVKELSKDFAYLKKYFSGKMILAVSFAGILTIPCFITMTYLKDKSTLEKTLNYIYTPDFSKNYQIDKVSLKRTLSVVKQHKDRSGFGSIFFGSQIPYLSAYFNWLVLDNLTLSDARINKIEKIFFGKASFELRPERIQDDDVEITNIRTKSTYDKNQNAWISWVDLEITNKSRNTLSSEYSTTIELPTGCWISDYYLYVGERKEKGILAEKKSAMWVFSQNRNRNRDPGILFYLTGNKVVFRVFPFAKDEVRKTGIEFLHKEPVIFTIDGNLIELGNGGITDNNETNNVMYVSSKQKQGLKQIFRKPYFHFLINVSNEREKFVTKYIDQIEQVVRNNKELKKNARISFVNTYVGTTKLDDNWEKELKSRKFEGGFYLDRAIKKAFFSAYQENSNSYPVIVVVTGSIKNAILDKDFSDFKTTFPESNLFFVLKGNGKLEPHSLLSNPIQKVVDAVPHSFKNSVLEYKHKGNVVSYLPDNYEPDIILKTDIFKVSRDEIKAGDWKTALIMQGMWMSQVLHPETAKKEWLSLVKYSFISKIMTPLTSYLVVENQAQKTILKKKQEQVLSGNKSLYPGEDTEFMSGPNMVIVVALFGLILLYIERRKKR